MVSFWARKMKDQFCAKGGGIDVRVAAGDGKGGRKTYKNKETEHTKKGRVNTKNRRENTKRGRENTRL